MTWFRPIRNKGTPKKKGGKSLKRKQRETRRRRGGMKSLNHRPGNLDALVRDLQITYRDVDYHLEGLNFIEARNMKIHFENQIPIQTEPLKQRVLVQLVEDIQKKIEDKESSLKKRKYEITFRKISPSPKSQK